MSRRRLFITTDAVGGVWQYATDLARALEPLDYETTRAILGPSPAEEQRRRALSVPGLELIDTGLPLDWLAENAGEIERAAERLARLSVERRADVVQLHTPALAVANFSAPVVVMMHSCVATWWRSVRSGPMPNEFFGWRTALAAEGLRRANRVVAPSAAFAQLVQETYALPVMPSVVHNGRALAAPASRAPHDFAFTAGRLWDAAKDAALLDRVAARLTIPFKAAGPAIGPNGERVGLQHLHLLGRIGEQAVADELAARPVFVSAARYEPFGLAVLEAANAGCALVLSDIPTFRELWNDAATFVAPGDADGFAAAVGALVGDMGARLAAGERARQRAERHTAAAMAEGIASIYAELSPRMPQLRPQVAA